MTEENRDFEAGSQKTACGNWVWLNTVTGETATWYCHSPRCDRNACRMSWAHARIKLIGDLVVEYQLNKFFTLTLPKHQDEDNARSAAWKDISGMWLKMRKRLHRKAREYGEKLLFVAVLESHKDGYPHVHGFTNLWLAQETWSNMWEECSQGGSYVWVERVKEGDAVKLGQYCNKNIAVFNYVGKKNISDTVLHIERKKRIMWRSRNMRTIEEMEKEKSAWVVVKL